MNYDLRGHRIVQMNNYRRRFYQSASDESYRTTDADAAVATVA
jgi:hypothetical protein